MDNFEILTSPSSTIEEKQEAIKNITKQRLCQMLGTEEIPTELSYIYDEVCIKRFNKLGNEGMDKYTQEGMTLEFSSSDFDEFKNDIDNWLSINNPKDVKFNGSYLYWG